MIKENNIKQVVISKQSYLLSPYWFIEFLKLKGYKDIFVYKRKIDKKYQIIAYQLENNIENINSFDRTLDYEYSSINLGEEIKDYDFEEKTKNNYLSFLDLIENREDKDLIEIAKKINNEKIIKIVEIPIDVKYEVLDCECVVGEYIEEKHRIWN